MLVMSNIPTQVRAVIDVDLPRPRKLIDLVESDRANDIKKQALSILHAEAMRSFSRGSKAAADFVALAILGAALSSSASFLQTRGYVGEKAANAINHAGYGCMGMSMVLFAL